MTRISTIATSLVLLLGLAAPVAAQSQGDTEFTFHGGGWGHSVGMSQWGAQGQALEGRTGQQIMEHYYTGATVSGDYGGLWNNGQHVDPLWIGLIQNQTSVDFYMVGGSGSLCLAGDGLDPSGACPYPATDPARLAAPGERWRFRTVQSGGTTYCEFAKESPPGSGVYPVQGPNGLCSASITWDPGASINLPNQGRTYPYGQLRFRPSGDGATFHEILTVPMEQYLYGIAETLNGWDVKAHQAQAIAARSYAVSRARAREPSPNPGTFDPELSETQKAVCYCHLYDDTRDQFFVGQSSIANWNAAVDATARQVLTYGGGIATTYYSSSTYGRTEPVHLVFGGPEVPYLQSVDDHWSDPGATAGLARTAEKNTNWRWTVELTGSALASKVGLSDVASVSVAQWSPSGAAAVIRFRSSSGAIKDLTGWQVRQTFGLKSPQVYLITAPLTAPPGSDGVGVHDSSTGIWQVRGSNGVVSQFYFGNPADQPYVGDWNGDGIETPGLYRRSTGFLFLRNSNTQGIADVEIYYGDPDDIPVSGDWNGDGIDTVGVYRPSTATFYLRNTNTQGIADVVVPFGAPGDVPLAGDWNGDGIDTVGVFRPPNVTFYATNAHSGTVDVTWQYTNARSTDKPVVGDWNGDGIDTISVFRPTDATFYLRDTYTQASANLVIPFGQAHMTPVGGWWGM